MTPLFLTKQQIDLLTYPECQTHIKNLNKTYNFNKPLKECFDQVWPVLDELTNTMLYLEDRIVRFEDVRIPSMDPGVEIIKPHAEEALMKDRVRPGRQARPFRIGDKVYANIHEAVLKTGIKFQTLKTYVSRHPDRYGYIG